jgi:hypothetical protein
MPQRKIYTNLLGKKIAEPDINVSYHVISGLENNWKVYRSSSSRATRSFLSRNDAIAFAKSVAKKLHAPVYIHDKKGQLQQTITAA